MFKIGEWKINAEQGTVHLLIENLNGTQYNADANLRDIEAAIVALFKIRLSMVIGEDKRLGVADAIHEIFEKQEKGVRSIILDTVPAEKA